MLKLQNSVWERFKDKSSKNPSEAQISTHHLHTWAENIFRVCKVDNIYVYVYKVYHSLASLSLYNAYLGSMGIQQSAFLQKELKQENSI